MRSSNKTSIRYWPASERPRERLLELGPEALSDAELVAVLLRNGVQGKDAISVSRELLSKLGGLRGLLASGAPELQKIKGLGLAKIAALLAVTEITHRKLKEEIIGKNVIRDPESVVQYLYMSLRDKKKEVFKVIFLDKANRVLDESDLFHGTVDEAAVHPRELVKAALDRHATAVILVHNHPSGRVEPSAEDRQITEKLKAACAMVSVKLLDHIIVGDNKHFSFNEHGLL